MNSMNIAFLSINYRLMLSHLLFYKISKIHMLSILITLQFQFILYIIYG